MADPSSVIALRDVLAITWHRRVRLLALIGGGAFACGTLIALTLPLLLGRPGKVVLIFTVLCGTLTLLSALTWLLARRTSLSTSRVLDLGLGYVVIAALAMAVAEVLLRREPLPTSGVPGLCIWIVLFPLILPCPPLRAALVAGLSATTLPATYAIFRWRGWPAQPHAALIDWWMPAFFCAGLAVTAAWSLHRLTRALEQARERLRELGSYRLERKLGEGGMGEVWLARHRLLPRAAAVKFIRGLPNGPEDAQRREELVARFQREAEAIALLEDPHTVRIFDFGVDLDGRIFYAMEHLDGMDLQSLVDQQGPLPWPRALGLLSGVCAALGEAHGKGLVHRDLKPGNIMACRVGGTEIAKVLDFGIVGAMQEAIGRITAPITGGDSGVAGTPGYIAPEQLLSAVGPDPRADVYAIGATAFFLLTGRTVFPSADEGEDLVAHTLDAPPAPSRHSRQELPAALDALVVRCLAKDPTARPAHAGMLGKEFAAILAAAADQPAS